jgi:Ca2+-binding RTX toxin-like protein
MTRIRALALAGVALTMAGASVPFVASPAYAATGTITVSGGYIYYVAAAGQTNNVVISRVTTVAEVYEFNDLVPISSTACTYPDPADATRMFCLVAGAIEIHVNVGDGDDTVSNVTNRGANVIGGTGNDTVSLGGRPGAAGSANGGDGNDLIKSGLTNDSIVGGPGTDTISFTGTDDPVSVNLASGTGSRSYDTDTYNGIENVTGGGGDDVIHGDNNGNTLDGGAGSCPVRGCVGPSGADRLYGHGGVDWMGGRDGPDLLYGGDGNDVAVGGDGNDNLYGENGNDFLNGDAGSDIITGGPGYDTCSADWQITCEANW